MPTEVHAILCVLVCLAAAVAYYLVCRRSHGDDERGLPPVLRGTAVAHAEETFKSHRHGLVAKLDRAYRVGKDLVLVELKTRAKDVPYMKDIIELSVQRLALQEQTRTTVSMTAWVIVENPSTRRRAAHRVSLLDDDQVLQLRDRYIAVAGGWPGKIKGAATAAQCRNCGHASRCSERKR